MTLTFDETTYTHLLAQASPKVIETEAEYERILAITERLHFTKISNSTGASSLQATGDTRRVI